MIRAIACYTIIGLLYLFIAFLLAIVVAKTFRSRDQEFLNEEDQIHGDGARPWERRP